MHCPHLTLSCCVIGPFKPSRRFSVILPRIEVCVCCKRKEKSARLDQLELLSVRIRLRLHLLLSPADGSSACLLVSSVTVNRNTCRAGWRHTRCIVSVSVSSVSRASFCFHRGGNQAAATEDISVRRRMRRA